MEIPPRLSSVYEKLRAGCFRAGIEELRSLYDWKRPLDRILMAEFLLRTGEWQKSEALARTVLEVKSTPPEIQARAYEHLAYHSRLRGGRDDPVHLLEQSLRIASKRDFVEQICRAQIALLSINCDVHGPDSLGTLPSEVCSNVTRSGNPHLRLWLHLRFAEMEAKKGGFAQAERHFELCASLLTRHHDLWAESRLNLLRGAIAEMTSNLTSAVSYTDRALALARESGCVFEEAASLSNLGHLCITMEQLDRAREHLAQARIVAVELPCLRTAIFDNLAILELRNGEFDASANLLERAQFVEHGARYADLENSLTAVSLLQRRGNLEGALALAKASTTIAVERVAPILLTRLQILQIDILLDMGRLDEAKQIIGQIDTPRSEASFKLLAELERVRGRVSARSDAILRAQSQFGRAARILSALGHVSSCAETVRQAEQELRPTGEKDHQANLASAGANGQIGANASAFVAATRIFQFGSNPVLLGEEALLLLEQTGVAVKAAILGHSEQHSEVVRDLNWPDAVQEAGEGTRRIRLGTSEHVTYELLVSRNDAGSFEELAHPLADLVTRSIEMHELRWERIQRTSLWPTDIALPDAGPMFYSEKMREVRQQALRMASTELKVLITGETGVGKEIIARLIHQGSKRSEKRFEAVNCSSVPRELFEAHLFGYRKGAFTGAISDSPGVIRGNDGGTIFFDEIGELSSDFQVKLLRVLDAREIHPLGATQSVAVDFRIIAATNADLHQLMEEKRFREDLFYRLNVATLRVPPLRERREEILPFIQYFLSQFCAQSDKPLPTLSDEAREYLLLYNWPGNVRELRNEMERVAGLADEGAAIRVADLKPEIVAARRSTRASIEAGPNELVVRIDQPLEVAYEQIARRAIVESLKRNQGNLEATAKDLGLTRKGLYNKRLRFGML